MWFEVINRVRRAVGGPDALVKFARDSADVTGVVAGSDVRDSQTAGSHASDMIIQRDQCHTLAQPSRGHCCRYTPGSAAIHADVRFNYLRAPSSSRAKRGQEEESDKRPSNSQND